MGRISPPRPSSKAFFFAKEIGAKITAVTVTEPFHFLSVSPSQLEYTPIEYRKYSKDHAEKVLGVVSDAAKLACVVCDTLHVEHEQVYQAIIEAAEARKCDLIVMASHGRRGVSAVVLGSETVKVLTHSKIPCSSIAEGCSWRSKRQSASPTALGRHPPPTLIEIETVAAMALSRFPY